MMPGVEILNVMPYTVETWGWSSLGLVLIIIGIILFLYILTNKKCIFFGVYILCFLSFIAMIAFGTAKQIKQYRYEVTVENTVDINEFTEKYAVLEQKEKIFLIEERDPEAKQINRALKESS